MSVNSQEPEIANRQPAIEDQAGFQPRIVAFVCNWCTYAGADLAGTSRTAYQPNVRIVKLPCSGRIDPHFILRAFEQGADGMLVSGCHPGDCHYTSGNYYARRKFALFRKLMEFLGLEVQRLQFSWVSAAEGKKWAEVVDAVTAEVATLGPVTPPWGQRRGIPDSGFRIPERASVPEAPDLAAKLRETARELLMNGVVNVVVGYGNGTVNERPRPLFVTSPDAVDSLIWNRHCVNNLATYLTRDLVKRLGKIGLIAKGCDVKSVVGLLQERQVNRESVTLIGMECLGVEVEGVMAAKCEACDTHLPPLADRLVSMAESVPADVRAGQVAAPQLVAEVACLEAMPPAQRREYWQAQFDRCLRCYACRAVCPLCYCERCIADKNRPQWVPTSPHGAGNLSWNLFRAFHLAGRCVGCGECARVCPANLRLDLLNAKLSLEVEREFGYIAGQDPEAAPPLATFKQEDNQDFIR